MNAKQIAKLINDAMQRKPRSTDINDLEIRQSILWNLADRFLGELLEEETELISYSDIKQFSEQFMKDCGVVKE
jgi:hypothetical protein